MIFSRALLVAASLVGLVNCQTWTSVNISAIPIETRNYWCEGQTSSCPLLCLQMPGTSDPPKDNTCDSDSLIYSCICDNDMSPNASQYSQTIPYFLCTEANNECVKNCNGISSCQSACRDDHPCGAQNPKRVNVSSTASATSNPTNPVQSTTLAAFTGEPTKKSAAVRASAVDLGHVYGLCVVVGGFIAGFAVLL